MGQTEIYQNKKMPNGIKNGFFHWGIKVTYCFEKKFITKGKPQTTPYRPYIAILKDRIIAWKKVQKYNFIQKMLVTDVVNGKYIEEAQQLKL